MTTDPSTPPLPADQPNWASFTRCAIITAVIGWIVFAAAGVANLAAAGDEKAKAAATSRLMVGYLTGFVFWASLPLGAMALLMIRYTAKTSWGLLLTRPFEAATRTLPLTIILFVPLAVAVATHEASPYWWSSSEHKEKEAVKSDPSAHLDKREQALEASKIMVNRAIDAQHSFNTSIQAAKTTEESEISSGNNHFLSTPSYIGVGAVLFLIWGVMIALLNKWGKETSEAADPAVVDRGLIKLQNLSGPGLIVFAITTTVSASQWVMSTEPGWSSTMFPVIFAVNQFLTAFAFCLALFLLLASRPPFAGHMRPKFQLDMGTLLLAFTLFWSYTSFSQFMLVWIGNLPEEIPFFLKRSNIDGNQSGWWYVSAALIALHFALPFVLLLFRDIKSRPSRLRMVAIYLVLICMVDVIWWIAPSATNYGHFPTWLIDAGAILGVGGVWSLYFLYQLKQRPLFPDNQAFLLPEGHHHEQH